MPLGYDVKEEATEIKQNLSNSRATFLLLVLSGVAGGIVTRLLIPESITKGSILNKIKSYLIEA